MDLQRIREMYIHVLFPAICSSMLEFLINVYLTLPNDRCTIVKAGLVAAAADGYFDPETQELTDDTADYAVSNHGCTSAWTDNTCGKVHDR